MKIILKKLESKILKLNKTYNHILQEIENQNIINTFCFKFLETPTKQASPTAQLIKDIVRDSSVKHHPTFYEIVGKSSEEYALENFRVNYFRYFRKKFDGVKQFKMGAGGNDFILKFFSYNFDQGLFRKNNFYI